LLLWLSLGVCVSGEETTVTAASADTPVLNAGEVLHFRVSWSSFYVGDAYLQVLPIKEFKGAQAYHFSLTAQTKPIIDPIYKARRRVDSLVDASLTRSLHFEKWDELDKDRHVVVYFDWDKQTVQYTRPHKRRQPIAVPTGTFDPLGVFYALRHRDLREGVVHKAPVTDGKRCVIAEARVIGKETIEIESGTYDTYVVEPDLGRVIYGIFKKRENAKVRVWVTADEDRIPVRVESKVAIGSFVAELVSREMITPHDVRAEMQIPP
jgi:hypothetical protein